MVIINFFLNLPHFLCFFSQTDKNIIRLKVMSIIFYATRYQQLFERKRISSMTALFLLSNNVKSINRFLTTHVYHTYFSPVAFERHFFIHRFTEWNV